MVHVQVQCERIKLAVFVRDETSRGKKMSEPSHVQRGGWSWWYLLFVVQFLAIVWPPIYNKAEPSWIGLPFYYWYQLGWVILGAILTAIVYFATNDDHH
jgi:hypothetical protein